MKKIDRAVRGMTILRYCVFFIGLTFIIYDAAEMLFWVREDEQILFKWSRIVAMIIEVPLVLIIIYYMIKYGLMWCRFLLKM